MFQSEDVFNKKKKIILFDIASSFIDQPTLREIVRQTHIAPETIASTYSIESISTSLLHAVSHLEDLPIEVLNTIIDTIEISPSTMELIQTLKIMGYKIGLMSNGFAPFTDSIKKKLDIDYCFGIDIPVDDDAKMIIGGLSVDELKIPDRQQIFAKLKERESVGEEDITIITDLDMQTLGTPGIRLQFNMKIILDYFNQHILNREALIGLLGSFGIPRLA
jgi:phosphoserine phosphatase